MKISEMFKGRKLVIATMHKKEQVIAPLLEKHFGVKIIVPQNFNSDKFGTFTREIKRPGDQLEVARAKVCAAMEQEGVDLGVSSEGSFGAHPEIPFMQSNFELVLFIDKKNEYEIRGHHQTQETNIDGRYVHSVEEALIFAKEIGFPNYGLIVRKSENGKFNINKNIENEKDLIMTTKSMLSSVFTKKIFIETDMRAHKNPGRMKAIKTATEDLVKNIKTLCPKCKSPGFSLIDFERGLRCSVCDLPTDLVVNKIYKCSKCSYIEKKPFSKTSKKANPKYCRYCNP